MARRAPHIDEVKCTMQACEGEEAPLAAAIRGRAGLEFEFERTVYWHRAQAG